MRPGRAKPLGAQGRAEQSLAPPEREAPAGLSRRRRADPEPAAKRPKGSAGFEVVALARGPGPLGARTATPSGALEGRAPADLEGRAPRSSSALVALAAQERSSMVTGLAPERAAGGSRQSARLTSTESDRKADNSRRGHEPKLVEAKSESAKGMSVRQASKSTGQASERMSAGSMEPRKSEKAAQAGKSKEAVASAGPKSREELRASPSCRMVRQARVQSMEIDDSLADHSTEPEDSARRTRGNGPSARAAPATQACGSAAARADQRRAEAGGARCALGHQLLEEHCAQRDWRCTSCNLRALKATSHRRVCRECPAAWRPHAEFGRCPHGHRLKDFKTPRAGYQCDACLAVLPRYAHCKACTHVLEGEDQCEFHMCITCFLPEPKIVEQADLRQRGMRREAFKLG